MFYLSKKNLLNIVLFLFCTYATAQDAVSIPDSSDISVEDLPPLSDPDNEFGGALPPPPSTNPRKALVIGIANYYRRDDKLDAPVNDARKIAGLLRKSNWYVAGYENLQSKQSFVKVVNAFKAQLRPNDQAIFYFSGHGFQYGGKNYLVPANAKIQTDADIDGQNYALDIEEVLGGAKCKIVILDACRNQLKSSMKQISGLTRGLKIMTTEVNPRPFSESRINPELSTSGTLIAYATAYGKPAIDGKNYSVFTKALCQVLIKSRPCTSFTDILQETRSIVVWRTQKQQVPWDSSSLTGKFVLKPCSR
jgi:uncharacterized protein